MKTLTLALKKEYFDQIKSGEKLDEFRLVTDYWKKRLIARPYDELVITMGYPKKDDHEKRLTFKYDGYTIMKIAHPHFGVEPVNVFAISLRFPK